MIIIITTLNIKILPFVRAQLDVLSKRVVFFEVRVVSKDSLWVSVYPPIVAWQRLSKHVLTATKNCWKRRYLCGPCCIEGK
jgi:hypothetical protein